jgi:uncharacterized protein YjdB/regulation of enolase protein 1 (concanavalin A-like superfamily)
MKHLNLQKGVGTLSRAYTLSFMFKPINRFVLLLTLSLAFFAQSFAAEYTVSSADDFNDLCSSLTGGDVVTWTNGTYSDQEIAFYATGGTASNPITLQAETSGSVIFNGSSTLNLSGDYLVMEGFYWKDGEGEGDHVQFRRSGSSTEFANNCTLRNCAFDNLYTVEPEKSRWIVLHGENNVIENCSFVNKLSAGAAILVELSYAGSLTPGHIIRNNYFYNITAKDAFSTNSGDCEAIRIGVSSYQYISAQVLVEGNYFQEANGENEIITNKSTDNTFLHNTFRSCRGSLVLRHGANAWVEGNFFLGEGKAQSGGIRVTDSYHTIINNYMQGLSNDGDEWNNGITLVGGSATSGGTSSDYQKVDDIVVAFNTIYNSDDPIYYNDRSSYDPTGVIAYNSIYSTNGTIIAGDISGTGQGMTYVGNIFGGSTLGVTDGGITEGDANFSASGEIYKPSSTGLVANAAGSTYNSTVTTDVEGYSRPSSNMDVGAFEVSGASGSAVYAPITDSQVGDGVGACFMDASGSAKACGTTTTVSVTGVSVSPTTVSLSVGGTEQLTATIAPTTATTKTVSWKSSNTAIATVSSSGLITAVAAGSATITVTTTDGSKTATCAVTISASGEAFVPDPSKTYYIDCPYLGYRIAADGESEDAYTTSTSTTGADVEWKFTDKGNGYWHIDRAAGGTMPRLRTDNSEYADMQPTAWTGSYTYYDFTTGSSTGTYFLTLPDGPTNYNRLQVDNSGLVKMVSTANVGTWESFTITEVSTSTDLPSAWETDDIGAVGATGSASYDNGTFDLEGSGADIWGAADEFRFVYQEISGDVTIIARVASVENTDAWAKAGVMIRESLEAGSVHAMNVVTPSKGTSFQRRTITDATSAHTTISGITAPQWMRVERSGDTFTASYSADGNSWTTVGSVNISMNSTVYVGLVTASHADGVLCSASFDNVSVSTSSEPVELTNLALNKSVSASDESETATPPSNAVDGDADSRWAASGYPQWLEVDLGGTYSISETELICYNDRAYQYVIEVSTDGSSYTEIVDRSSNSTAGSNDAPIADAFSSVNARYVKITVSGADSYTGTWVSLEEFRVYGDATSLKSVETSESFAQQSINTEMLTYPNPASDVLNFEMQNLNDADQLVIYSTTGQLVYTQALEDLSGSIDISQLSTGMYFIKTNGQSPVIKRFIKQ